MTLPRANHFLVCRRSTRDGVLPARTRFVSAPQQPTPVEMKEPTMLVLSRHRDESIMIGDNIVVTIVDIRGDKVRLGIDAPQDIPVHRQEVYDAIQRENRKASQLRASDARNLGKPNSPNRQADTKQ
jgi:carbon storage regulator